MGTIPQLLISGTAIGFIYTLVAIKYTLIWSPAGLLDFSHDKIITVGAYIFAATFIIKFNMNRPLAIILALILMGILGPVIASGVFNPLRRVRSSTFAVMGTMMLGRTLAKAIRFTYGPVSFTIKSQFSGTIKIGTLTVTKTNVIICVMTILIVATLQLFMNSIKIRKAMRCMTQNERAVVLMGINVAQSICVTVVASSIIRSAIGVLVMPLLSISAAMAANIGLKGFLAGVTGGLGHLPGAILGGLLIEVVENLAVVVLPAVYKDVVSLVLLIIFLLAYPSGFLSKEARKE